MPSRNLTIDSDSLTPSGKFRLATLDALDGRTLAARRAKNQIAALENDLGGRDNLNVRERMLIRDVAFLDTFIEDCASRYIGGQSISVSDWTIAINAKRRILAMFGLEGGPAPGNVTPQPEELAPAALQRIVEKVMADRGEAL